MGNKEEARERWERWNRAHPGTASMRALKWNKEHKDRRKEITKSWDKRNPESVSAKNRRYRERHLEDVKKKNRQRNPLAVKNGWLKRHYGITVDQFNSLMVAQGGVCLICGEPPKKVHTRSSLCVDHDHATKKVRGLLCTRCNRGLGHFKDDVALLKSAISYLERLK